KSRNVPDEMVICATRYGNVMASRGSVIPLFVNQILTGKPIRITDPNMTRFMMTIDDAVDLVVHVFEHGQNGDIFVQKSPAATIEVLTRAILEIMKSADHTVNIIGTRHGEKLYEVLCSREEMLVAEDQGNYYRIPCDKRDLNYEKYFEKGNKKVETIDDYNSHNTYRLNTQEMVS
ncbi:polysaccharide biosynthesis protein, partial [Escherichia coli]|uniref:polysaccharide biosynthesis protein n=1 Tax=Escherichia coli TaxID=562 RepID=UPI00132F54B8